MSTRKSKRGNFEIEDLGNIELPPELDQEIQLRTKAAEAELDATRVNFRWQREPLNLIKTVAGAMGIPYQTYIKQVLYRQALEDLRSIQNNPIASQGLPQSAIRKLFTGNDTWTISTWRSHDPSCKWFKQDVAASFLVQPHIFDMSRTKSET